MDCIDQYILLPFHRTATGILVIVEEISGHECLGLDPAMIAGNGSLGGLVVLLIAGDSSKDGLFDDRNLILIRARDSRSIRI